MGHDVTTVWQPMQMERINNQQAVEQKALALVQKSPEKARQFLTQYSIEWGDKVVKRCWELGDFLWTKYDEKF